MSKVSEVKCPYCQGNLYKEILYGLPDSQTFDFAKYEVGGCCVSDNDYQYLCVSCGNKW